MRGAFVILLAVFAVTLPATAQDTTKPNTLTPKEIADGWILLFDGETTFGWKIDEGQGGTIAAGWLVAGGKVVSNLTFRTSFPSGLSYRFEGRDSRGTDARFTVPGPSVLFAYDNPVDEEKRTKVQLLGQTLSALSGKLVPKNHTGIRIIATVPRAEKVYLRSFRVQPLGLHQIFNGKDLTGWHVFPGKKSQFTVEDGCIVCKNGPGDLQTDGKYANFVLQLECKVNGKHLNSGIFFRCKANEYQNGYEAQIHNDFTAHPPKTCTVDEYDPKTHKLTGKKKVQSAAKDYGTGAIYRRVPARKAVAKDGEWFTMTIVAQGNHIATWVNGIQQVDWYDYRPASDNPRTGCRLAAGHISIQGHDPTTNLSFRNIRIAELPGTGK